MGPNDHLRGPSHLKDEDVKIKVNLSKEFEGIEIFFFLVASGQKICRCRAVGSGIMLS